MSYTWPAEARTARTSTTGSRRNENCASIQIRVREIVRVEWCREPASEMSKSAALLVACVGSSATAAIGSYDWIADLHSRPENAAARFVNCGVGATSRATPTKRLPAVLQSRPNRVIVLIGANDVLTRASKKLRRFLGAWKRFPMNRHPNGSKRT